jgi:hypothetical protein
MAAQGSVKDWYTFVGGLNTEGGYFVTPDGTWKQGRNIVPQTDGSIERRNGLDFETGYTNTIGYFPTDINTDLAITVGKWSPTNSVDLLVVQVGTKLHFYYDTSSSISSTQLLKEINLSDYVVGDSGAYAVDAEYPCSFAQAYGNLVVTHRAINPILLTYEAVGGFINAEEIKIKVRDFEGFNTFGTEPTDEFTEAEWISYYLALPGSYSGGSSRALYNLKNQGWNDAQITAYKTANSNKLPANTKIWFYGKDSSDNFSASLLNKQEFGTGLAPKGRYIVEAFNPTRSEGGLTVTNNSFFRPSVTGFFAGRIWYAGCPDPDFSSKVYFSQVLDTIEKVGDCYQRNDPTSEILSDLLDSDGGNIEVPEAGQIVKLIALGRGLLIFAENGIFSVSGLDGIFSAANYQVEKISAVGTVFPETVVIVNNGIMFWSTDGVYSIIPQAGGLSFNVDNVSNAAIRTFYNDITFQAKTRACGAYNSTTNEIAWLYDESTDETLNINSKKTTMLVYNVSINSWYVHDLTSNNEHYPAFIFVTKPNSTAIEEVSVVNNNGDTLRDAAFNDVVTNYVSTTAGSYSFKIVSTMHEVEEDGGYLIGQGVYYTPSGTYPFTNTVYEGPQIEKSIYTWALMSEDTQAFWGVSVKLIRSTLGSYVSFDVSESSTYHPGFGTWSFFFNNDGSRMYVSQYNTTTDEARIAYYTIVTGNITGYTVVLTSTTTTVRNQILFTDMKRSLYSTTVDGEIKNNTVMGLFTIPNGLTSGDMYLKTIDLDDDGNIPTPVSVDYKFIGNNNKTYSRLMVLTNTDILLMHSSVTYGSNQNEGYLVLSLPVPAKLHTITTDEYDIQKANWSRFISGLGITNLYAVSEITPYGTKGVYEGAGEIRYIENNPFLEKVNFDLIHGSASYDARWKSIHIGFADFNNTRNTETKFIDWYSKGYTVENEAFVLTGYHMADNGPARQATGTYLTTFAKRTETALDENGDPINPSKINMEVRWDFTDNESANKWSTAVNVYRPPRMYIGNPGDTYDDGYPLVISKSKIRGRGKALQFKYSSEPGYDMKLVGWTGTFVGNTNV